MKPLGLILIGLGLILKISSQIPIGSGGGVAGGGGGTAVTVAAPYVTFGATKVVGATMWPFVAFFSGTFLDTNTATLTAGTNGSELLSFSANANSWYSVAATTSIEAELGFTLTTTNANSSGGIWIYDSTNSKIYSWEISLNNGTSATAYQETSWACTSPCNNPSTPGTPTVLVNIQLGAAGAGPYHFKLVKTGGNLLAQTSADAGQTYTQFNSTAVGTITKAGVDLRGTTTDLITLTILSSAVN